MTEKIGVGIVTCGREDMFKKLFSSLKQCESKIDHLFVVEDTKVDRKMYDSDFYVGNHIQSWKAGGWGIYPATKNLGVGKAKNLAIKNLLDHGCDHIFIIEDDMFIKNPDIFDTYINASKKSGIQHFNFSQHGVANKRKDQAGNILSNPKFTVDYGGISISFYQHCVGSFSYYSKECLEDVGFMDERYYNACEHVDHTYEIIKSGYHPPFWWFADIEKSEEYIGDDGWSIETSSICSAPDFNENVKNSDSIFKEKHGHYPIETPTTSIEDVKKYLKSLV